MRRTRAILAFRKSLSVTRGNVLEATSWLDRRQREKYSCDQAAPVDVYERSLDGPYVTDVFSNHQSIGCCDSLDKPTVDTYPHRCQCYPQLMHKDIVSFRPMPNMQCIYN